MDARGPGRARSTTQTRLFVFALKLVPGMIIRRSAPPRYDYFVYVFRHVDRVFSTTSVAVAMPALPVNAIKRGIDVEQGFPASIVFHEPRRRPVVPLHAIDSYDHRLVSAVRRQGTVTPDIE